MAPIEDPGSPHSSETGPQPRRTAWHALTPGATADALGVSLAGLDDREARARLEKFGRNRLKSPPSPSRLRILLRQFQSPLIYVLFTAATIAVVLGEYTDAGFITAVLLVNALIGYANEYRAEREVHAMLHLVPARARVHRGKRAINIDSQLIVPGDLVLLESGSRVSADLRLVETHGLRIDESLLTGESVPVPKNASAALSPETPVADRLNMAFAGSMVASGRGMGLVVLTGLRTEVGAIARQVAAARHESPPLLKRMERFAKRVGAAAVGMAGLVVVIGLLRGLSFQEVLLAAIALAVSAIPEGLPIALTVALAVAVSRMAKRRVLVRSLPAVEALGSCALIATDKTGTLTQNQLTVQRIVTGATAYEVSGGGYTPTGGVFHKGRPVIAAEHPRLFRLMRAAALANEGSLAQREDEHGEWEWSGDPTDVALLALAIKSGLDPVTLVGSHPPVAEIPFEPEHRYAARFHRRDGGGLVCLKGAPERVLEMCATEPDEITGEDRVVDRRQALDRVGQLMRQGYRVLAVADAETGASVPPESTPPEPAGLSFLGLVAMTDPPREGVTESISRCRQAGVRTVMITGDHALTAAAVATRIGLADPGSPVITGEEIAALDDEALAGRLDTMTVVARATPADKLRVVEAHQRRGIFVAVTGDGVNDAPALKQADIGVAMGRSGTDVAREAADIVITDDDFSSILAGVEEGRVAYDNVRKVTYLLISTGAGEVLAVMGALALGLPVPFTAVQLLWLNLVTNGIQDVALAFEPKEPGIMERPPRSARQGIFDRLMIERTLLAGLVFGLLGLACFSWWTHQGLPLEDARNRLVQLFVLFEIFHIGNARSETRSLFRMSPVSNPVLLLGTLAAVGVHVIALFTPFTQALLDIKPLPASEWLLLGAVAATIVLVMEIHKSLRAPGRRKHPGRAQA